MKPLIINIALTGMIPTKKDNPHLPVTPREIALDVKRCYEAGASIFHIHARDKDEQPTWRLETYKEIVGEIRYLVPNAVICGSTSGRNWSEIEKRLEVLQAGIQLASLTLGSLNFPTGASVNAPETIKALAMGMNERGIIPELEAFDMGMISYSKYLIEKGILKPPYYYNLFLGSLGTLEATPFNLIAMVQNLPLNAEWGATGIGKYQFEVNTWAIAMGGHVRVGLEDSIYMDTHKTDLGTNLRMVERVVKVAKAMGREICQNPLSF